MSHDSPKLVAVRLPECLTREAKAAAAMEGIPLRELYRQAIEERVKRAKEEPAPAE